MPHETGGPPSDEYYAGADAGDIIATAPGGEVWLFAFGSLIWNKRFTYDEERTGVARGWHRDFCLGPDTRYRGNPAAPGYMLSLDRGGQCKGMVYRFPPGGPRGQHRGPPPQGAALPAQLGQRRHRQGPRPRLRLHASRAESFRATRAT